MERKNEEFYFYKWATNKNLILYKIDGDFNWSYRNIPTD